LVHAIVSFKISYSDITKKIQTRLYNILRCNILEAFRFKVRILCIVTTSAFRKNYYKLTNLAMMRSKLRSICLPPNKLFFLISFLLLSAAAFSQAVTGTVTDAEKKPISNATVQVKGTPRATTTNDAGKFSINAAPNDVLVVSFVGHTSQEIPLNGQQSVTVSLASSNRNLEEVVVTALGIRRESKRLGYATSTVKTDEMVTNRTTNAMESLEGKVAGLNISPPAAGAGASTQIRLRGQVGFAGSNNAPLLVVNGLPLDQGARAANGNVDNRDRGDNLLNINPDDIETMTVLKGSTASALYGVRAAAGAILITTKSGAKSQGIGVEVTSSYSAQQALNYMDQYQTMYGAGVGGARPANVGAIRSNGQFGWGARLDGVPTVIFDGSLQLYSAYEDRLFQYFRTGANFTNTIALSGGGAKGSFRASVSNTDAKGIEPNNEYKRRIANLGLNQNIGEKLKLTVNINWANEEQINPPQIGTQGAGSVNFFTRLPISTPLSAYKNSAVDPVTGTEYQTSGFQSTSFNPYYAMQAGQSWINKRDRILGTSTLRYDLTDWLYLQGRYSLDYSVQRTETKTPGGIGTSLATNPDGTYKGTYNVTDEKGTDVNADFLLGASKEFGKFSVDANFGGNTWRAQNQSISLGATNFILRDFFSLPNGTVKTQSGPGNGVGNYNRFIINSLYGTADFGYNSLIYLSLTGRQDWFSVYNPQSNSVFYPSVSTSFIFSELLKSQRWLTYGKLRASWAQTGSQQGVGPYEGVLNYNIPTNNFNGQPTASVSQTGAPNPFLTPFKVSEQEIGLELKLFNNKLNFDITAFNKVTTDQVLDVNLSSSTGYTSTKSNLGSLRNRGLETMIEYRPFQSKNFTWSTSWNNAYLATKVLKLAPGQNQFLVIDFNSTGNEFLGRLYYTVGMPMNQLYTRTYLRDESGNILVNGSNGAQRGFPRATTDYVPVGSSIPKYTGGWTNNFTYKNFTLGIFLDYKFGGTVLSSTNLNLLRQGLSKASLVGRREGEKGIDNTNFPALYENTKAPNTTPVTNLQGFYAEYRNQQIGDPFVFKSDFVKLRNVSVAYNFSSLLRKGAYLKYIKGLSLSASVRNLAILYKDLPGLDPEAVQSSGDVRAGYENSSLPTTRNYNVTLNVKF
jgi:TonB-linked SusC/RagA family outer membrane protein